MEYVIPAAIGLAVLLLLLPRPTQPRPAALLLLVKPALLGAALVGGWIAWASLGRSPTADVPQERLTGQTMEYARGDDQLRAMLESGD